MNKKMTDVLFFIPEGKKNAISRSELAASAGYSDRAIRQIISQLREKGYLICSSSEGGGYFIATDPDEASEFYWQEKNRAISIFRSLSPIREYLKEKGRAV